MYHHAMSIVVFYKSPAPPLRKLRGIFLTNYKTYAIMELLSFFDNKPKNRGLQEKKFVLKYICYLDIRRGPRNSRVETALKV